IDNEPTGLQYSDIRLAYPRGTIFHRVEELPMYAQSQIDGEPLSPVDTIPIFVSKHRMVYANLRTEYPALYHLLNAQIFTPEEFDALLISSRFALILMAFDIIGKDVDQFVFCGRCYHEDLVKKMRVQLVEFMPLLHEYLNKPEVQTQIEQLEQLDQTELS
ncbi:hypothetical protein HN958_02995, partial [Candidatus Falkowbacteria bacterium]|nr:hypothetical protein [Candidatus Falkowbacteria bacterium]